MKFHELFAEHDIAYTFHEFEDLHPVYCQLNGAGERKMPAAPPLPEDPIASVITTTKEAILSVPILGTSAAQAINIAEESFNDMKDSESAKLVFATKVVEALEKGSEMTESDLARIVSSMVDYTTVGGNNYQNTRSWAAMVGDNIKLLKDLVVRFLNSVRNSESLFDAVVIVTKGILAAVGSIPRLLWSNRGIIFKLVFLAVAIYQTVTFVVTSAANNDQTVFEYLTQLFENIAKTGYDDMTWFVQVLQGTGELRDTILGPFKMRYEVEKASIILQQQRMTGALGVGAGSAATYLAASAAAAAATGPVGALAWAGYAVGVTAIGIFSYAIQEFLIDPTTDMSPIASMMQSPEDIMRSSEFQIQAAKKFMLAEQQDAAWSLLRPQLSPTNMFIIFSTFLYTANALFGLKCREQQLEGAASTMANIGSTCLQVQSQMMKSKKEVRAIYRQALEVETQLRHGAAQAALIPVQAFCNQINMNIDNKYAQRTRRITTTLNNTLEKAGLFTTHAKKYVAKMDQWSLERFLNANKDQDGNIEAAKIQQYIESNNGFDYKKMIEGAYTKREAALKPVPTNRLMDLPLAHAVPLRF